MIDFITCTEEKIHVVLHGEIDHHFTNEIRPLIDEKIIELKPKVLILDFSGVTFMDSSGVGLIMGRYRLMSETEGRIKVINIPLYLRHVVRISGLYKIASFDFMEEENENC